MGNYVNPHAGARRIEQKKKKYINPHSGAERNRGGVVEGTAYLAGNLGLGLAGVAEGIADIAVAGSHLSRGDLYMAKQPFLDNQTAQAQQDLAEWYNPGKGMQFAGDVASGIGNSLTFMIPYVGPYLAAAGYLGMGVSGAAEKTGDVGLKEIGYGAANAGMEFVMDKFVGGAGQAGKSIMSSLTRKGAATAGKATAKMAGKGATAYMLREIGKGALGEFAEEASTEAVDPLLQRLFGIDKNASTTIRDVAYAGLVGALSGGLMTAGPAAINFESARETGKAIREGGEVEQVLHTAEMLIKGSERAQTKAKETKVAEKSDKAESAADKIKGAATGVVGGIKSGRAASAAGEMADKLRRNVTAYRQMMADPARATTDAADALLGELRGNMYLAQVAYQMETYEAVLMNAEPEQKQQIVDVINAEAAKRGAKRSDYTVADLENNVDDILTSTAGRAVLESMMREMVGETAEAPQSPVEAQEDVWAGMPADTDMADLGVTGEAENALIKAAVNQGVPRGSVPAMLEQFRKGTALTPAEFAEGWADGAHKYGRYGFDASEDGDTAFSRMEPEAREAAMKYGRETEEAERKAAEEKAKAKKKPAEMAGKKGTVVRGKGLEIRTLSDEQYAAYKAAEVLAEVLGTEIVIETAITDEKGRTVNGYYDTKTNRLHVNINAMRGGKNISLYTLGHEVTHYIKEWSPAKFEALADFVLEQMGVDAETAVADKLASLKRLGIVTDTMTIAEANALAREELVAEGMELVLTDGKVLEELAKTDKSLWEKIRDWFFDIIGQIRRSWESLNQASKTAQVLNETVESLEEIERLFTEGVREAGERTRTAGIGDNISEGNRVFSFIGETKDGRPCYISGFDDSVDMDERIKVFKERVATIFNLGAVELKTDVKKIRILGDKFTAQKNVYGDHNNTPEEQNAKISSIYDLAHILSTSTYDPTATDTEPSYENENVKPKNAAHKNVKYWYKFRNEIVFDGVPYTVTFNIRDKGKEQFQYLIEFKENKTPGLSNTAVKGLLRTNRMSYGDIITHPDDSVNTSTENSSENIYDTEDGVMIDPTSGTAMLSVDDIPKTEQEIDDAVNRLVAKLGVDESRARKWVEDEISLATLILRDDMVDYAHRKADRRLTAIVKNSDYKQGTLDFSNICRKRREYTRMMQRIQQAFPNRRFTAEEFATIRKIMVDEGLEVACGLCYVEDRRQNEGYIAETFQRAVEAWRKGNRDTYYDTKNNVESAYNKGQAKAMAMLEGGDYVPTIADLTTVEGMNKLQAEHKDILQAWKAFNNARGMSSARLLTNEAEYQRQILRYRKDQVKRINDLGGLRVFSFSDFEEFHLIDIIQAVQDCAAMGIKIQFYTKVPSFALLMKDTKAKGNLSLIPKGDLGYEMKNGERVLVYDPVEGIDFNDPAFKEVARGNPNIGTILVGINDTQIRAAMADDFIDYIIPFHTGQTEVVRQIKKIGKWKNYKNEQVDKPLESGSKAKPVNVYTDVIAAAEREGNPIRNERQFVERFLKVCEERGLRPRFSDFLNTNADGKYVYTKGYYKLLLDFKMFDKDGTYLPQEPVIPEFDADLLYELTEKYVAGEKAKTEAESPAFKRALERVEAEVVSDDEGRMYSIDETPENADVSENRDLTDREILGMALEGAVQSQEEYNIVKSYREKAAMLELVREKRDGYIKEANALERQIKALRTRMEDEGDPDGWIRKAMDDAIAKKREAERMRDEQVKILDDADREILRMKAAKPFREIIARERKRVRAAEYKAERAEEKAEKARETTKRVREEYKEKIYKARRDATDYKRAVYRTAYEKAEEKNRAYRERTDRKADESRERKEMTSRKRTIMRVLGGLQTKLYNPTKTNHVPKELHDLVTKIMQTADPKAWDENRKNIREMGDLAAGIEKLERKVDRTEREQERLDAMKSKYEILESKTMPMKKQAEALYTAYKLYNETLPKDMQIPEGPMAELSKLVDTIEDAPLKEMGLESLRAVETFVKALSHQINSANDLFLQKRGEQVSDWGNAASREAAESKPLKWLSPKSMEIKNARDVRDFLWKNMKPLTVFEAIGSPKLTELFHSVLDGEEVWITDVLEAREVILKAKERYKYDTWDLKARREFANTEGKVVRLTVGEMMSLYAYAKREQAMGHLRGGGFVLDAGATEITEKRKVRAERRMNLTERYTMTEEDMGKLAGMLTEEQKRYADEMQDYLTSLGAKGNEISQKLYGLDLFNEKHYFPIKVKSEYLESQTGKTGDPKIKNRGMAKETVPDAENPLVLQDFMDIFNGHVNDMATYHAFVLPVEDLTRVLNYQPSNAIIDDEGNWTEDKERKEYSTLKAVIESKYGAQANAYIEQLIRDLNGGARREAAANLIDKGITAFKRASTMASLSVLVQQPTSLFRAMAYVDPKYFRSTAALDIKGHKEAWEQVKKYAKVAAIKEMGGYDTGVGTRTADYLDSKEYKTWGDRAKAFFLPDVYGGDPNYRAEIFGKGAAYADELAWIQMFDACKREQAEKLGMPMDSEEVLEAAGKRFTEVVRRTQVYDATLARSEYMRSKDTGMKMATAFMAEPTTVVSMMLDGLIRAKRGDKAFLNKTAGAIAASVIFNALAVSLVYAARDDDEEKTFTEKYLATLATETAEGFNPLEYLPYTRDIMSLMKGYDIERTDMALFADLFKSFERITSSTRTPAEKTAEVAGAVGAFFGIPVRNLVRDAIMPVNLVQGAMSGERTTGKGISAAMADEFSTITKLFGADTTNANQLYKAAKSGDEAHYNRVASRYKSEQAAEMALRTALRENDKRIAEAAEAKISGELEAYESIVDQIESEGRFDRNLIIRAINNEALDIKDSAEQVTAPAEDAVDEDEDTVESLYNASDLNDALSRGDREDFEDIYYYLLATKQEQGKTEAQAKAAVKSGITSYWKKRYLAAWDENNTAEMKRILELLEGTELYGEYNDVATMASKWIKES